MLNWKEAIEADAKRLKALSDFTNQENQDGEEIPELPKSSSSFDPAIRFAEP